MVDRGKAADIKDLEVHRFHAHVLLLAVHVAVNTGRLPLTREKRVRYRVDWLAIITTWKSSEIRDRQICLLSIIFEVASSRDQL